jgi:hypothetical protein
MLMLAVAPKLFQHLGEQLVVCVDQAVCAIAVHPKPASSISLDSC